MTVLTRFSTLRELNTLQERMNRLFNESFNGSEGRDESWPPRTLPAVDVTKPKQRYPEDRSPH